MSTKKKSQKRHRSISTSGGKIDTGGGAFVGGDVRVGKGGEFVGRDKTALTYEVPPEGEVSREALLELLNHMVDQVGKLESFNEWKRTELQGNLQTAAAMARAEEPPKEQLIEKLTTTQKILEAAKGMGSAAMGLVPLVIEAIKWARILF